MTPDFSAPLFWGLAGLVGTDLVQSHLLTGNVVWLSAKAAGDLPNERWPVLVTDRLFVFRMKSLPSYVGFRPKAEVVA